MPFYKSCLFTLVMVMFLKYLAESIHFYFFLFKIISSNTPLKIKILFFSGLSLDQLSVSLKTVLMR